MPFITVSRMFGAHGSDVAARVARTLGWNLLDNELVDAIASRSGLTPTEVSQHEEKVPSLVERIANALSLGSADVLPPFNTAVVESPEERIVSITRRVIQEAVHAGPTVFVGRGAQCLLAERSDALHVFCYAPQALLVETTVKAHAVDAREAARLVTDTNHRRRQYVRRHWDRDWLASENYHLCVNTGWLGTDCAAELVVDAARNAFGLETGS
jgi:cytidylate kinase